MPDRTFGWIQDPGKIANLRRVVEIFYVGSPTHHELVTTRINRVVTAPADRTRFLTLLQANPIQISYTDLKGTPLHGPRAQDPCNGIVQATLTGQRRAYQSDWASENFVRWAHSLGFVSYNSGTDTFHLSDLGRRYVSTPAPDSGINAVLEEAFLSYPPAVRVLRLLSMHTHLTKFEIGRQLGFVGENGFTSLPQDLLVRDLTREPSPILRNKMLSNTEGSSDKYARTIAGWLIQVGWVETAPKEINVIVAGKPYTYTIPQAYTITGSGQDALRRAEGRSRHARTQKNVHFQMLATNAPSRNYLRVRRAQILEAMNGKGFRTVAQILAHLTNAGLTADPAAVVDDLAGLENMGLQLERNPAGAYRLLDAVQSLSIPPFTVADTQRGDVQKVKDEIRNHLSHIAHERLVLIDLSFDGSQNRLFEQETMSLLLECGFTVAPQIGGANRPDGIVYTEGLAQDYGLIVDSKAYSQGFDCGANQRREMQNYIQENIARPNPHQTYWWRDYPAALTPPGDFRFLFVTSRFVRDFRSQFQRLSAITSHTRGAGMTAANLLLYAEALKAGRASLDDGVQRFGTLDEVIL